MFYEYKVYCQEDTGKEYIILGEAKFFESDDVYIYFSEIIDSCYGSERFILKKEQFFETFKEKCL